MPLSISHGVTVVSQKTTPPFGKHYSSLIYFTIVTISIEACILWLTILQHHKGDWLQYFPLPTHCRQPHGWLERNCILILRPNFWGRKLYVYPCLN
ncbi:hypothetical protein M433DRAFT_214070 [Acidomyces richmondensis BFW]|nr:MAG: hypothetical protein FE78DRAFT_364850 [Acidomyces sp. 'richmondensis']KYG46196.1 hypothetical protein M433DRAFT_214070 [Acidomyces richmondensis BFW]